MKKKENDKLAVPSEQPIDVAHSSLKGVIDSFPLIGGVLAEMKDYVFPSPIQKRREEWMIHVASCIREILDEINNFSLDSLKDNPQFISTVMQASLIAERTHQEEKIIALRNAVKNTAKGIDINESIQTVFLHYLDVITPLHLKLLKFLYNPNQWFIDWELNFAQYMGGISHAIEQGIPELKGKRTLYDTFTDDLKFKGLVTCDRTTLHMSMSKSGIMAKRTTDIGDDFLRYFSLI